VVHVPIFPGAGNVLRYGRRQRQPVPGPGQARVSAVGGGHQPAHGVGRAPRPSLLDLRWPGVDPGYRHPCRGCRRAPFRLRLRPSSPVAAWMLGKPHPATRGPGNLLPERAQESFPPATSTAKEDSADWLGGPERPACNNAKRGWQLHPRGGWFVRRTDLRRPIDDDSVVLTSTSSKVAPYLKGPWESVFWDTSGSGFYANQRARPSTGRSHDGIGSYFWQHNWGSAEGVHASRGASANQVEIDKRSGRVVSVSTVKFTSCRPRFGQLGTKVTDQ